MDKKHESQQNVVCIPDVLNVQGCIIRLNFQAEPNREVLQAVQDILISSHQEAVEEEKQ